MLTYLRATHTRTLPKKFWNKHREKKKEKKTITRKEDKKFLNIFSIQCYFPFATPSCFLWSCSTRHNSPRSMIYKSSKELMRNIKEVVIKMLWQKKRWILQNVFVCICTSIYTHMRRINSFGKFAKSFISIS